MSKEEFLKIQTCVLKVNIHCDGCKHKVKKILQKIEGVFTTKIDAEAGKVTVSGNVEPAMLIKKLAKKGKHAELWGAAKPNNNNNHLPNPNQFKNMPIDNGKGGNNNKNQKGNNNHPKSAGGPPNQHFQQQLQQLQQLQQMKGPQDLKLPQFNGGMKLPNVPQNNQLKTVKFAGLPDDDGLSDELDDEDDYDDDDMYDDEFDDDIDDHHNKMKPGMAGGGNGLPPAIQNMINAQKGIQSNGANNAKKGGPPGNGAIPVQINMGGGAAKNGGKNGGGNNNNNNINNHHHPQGGNQNHGGKNGGGKPQEAKNGNNGGGGGGKNGNGINGGGGHGNNMQGHGGKKGNNGGQGGGMNDGFQNMGGPQGQMGNMNIPMGHIGNMPMGQLGNMPAVQGLPAMNGGGGGGPNGYFQGAGPEPMPGNPYHQQQYLAAMMNQQRAMGNERFQPMMYARPPPAVNYMPPYPYPYPPHPHTSDPYTNFFNDENTSRCSVM